MAEFSEGVSPKEQNKSAIKNAWENLKDSIERSRGEVLLEGTDNLLLRYATSKPLFGDVVREINTVVYEQVSHNVGDDYARGGYEFKRAGDVIIVTTSTDTDPHRESQGYGSGLASLINKVIPDAIERFDDLKEGVVIGVMQDKAVGQTLNEDGEVVKRENWTSHQAQELGYTLDPESSVWFRKYRGEIDQSRLLDLLKSEKK